MTIGKNIKKIRESKNLTQEDFAKKLYVTRQTISNYENGRSKPDIDMLMNISKVLETDIQYILYGIPEEYSRKVSKKRLMIAFIIFIIMALITIPFIYTDNLDYFTYPNLYFIKACGILFYVPLMMLILGWCIMQFIALILNISFVNKSWTKKLRIGLFIVLILWYLFNICIVFMKNYHLTLIMLFLLENSFYFQIIYVILGILLWISNFGTVKNKIE